MQEFLRLGIGKGHPVFLVAEVGVNHNGSVDAAHALIDAAAVSGADGVKFQTFITEELVSLKTPLAGHHMANIRDNISHFDLIKRLELPFDAFEGLKLHCEDKGMVFISTPYDLVSADFLIKLGTRMIKVASSEMMNLPLLDLLRNSGTPIILSTGMSQWEEIVEAVDFLRAEQPEVCILKCTSNYPASPESINLKGIRKIRKTFPDVPVGFSDHSEGMEISLASLSMGVNMIERHFTLDRDQWGPDHNASMLPYEFASFTSAVRKVELAWGVSDWYIQSEEVAQRATMSKSVFIRKEKNIGERIEVPDVMFLRPGGGMSPREFYRQYKGKTLIRSVKRGHLLETSDLN